VGSLAAILSVVLFPLFARSLSLFSAAFLSGMLSAKRMRFLKGSRIKNSLSWLPNLSGFSPNHRQYWSYLDFLVENDCLFSHQGGIFLRRLATGHTSLRIAWDTPAEIGVISPTGTDSRAFAFVSPFDSAALVLFECPSCSSMAHRRKTCFNPCFSFCQTGRFCQTSGRSLTETNPHSKG
jgi:hypothetical protein